MLRNPILIRFSYHSNRQDRNLSDLGNEVNPKDWLYAAIAHSEEATERELHIPKRADGSDYEVNDLYDDQQVIMARVMMKLQEWLECDDLRQFEPLRITVNGKGGCGKSVLVNTIVATLRTMFGTDDVVGVLAPTGVAAYNVNGETFNHYFKYGVSNKEYGADSMGVDKRKKLIHKFKELLCLIIDERSLVSSLDLGTAEQHVKETIFQGGMCHVDWGGLPILILAGDDYQLPGVREGALNAATTSESNGNMTKAGKKTFLNCAKTVYELIRSRRLVDGSAFVSGSDRVRDQDRVRDRGILDRVRMGTDLTESDVKHLMTLDLNEMRKKHSPEYIASIEHRAMYLFYSNAKRLEHNMRKLHEVSTPDNPVAFIKTKSLGIFNKCIARHFSPPGIQPTCMANVGSRIALEGRNFNPKWGLHNGACGIVDEIVFAEGKSPNNGDHPEYIVVDFPLYVGPVWDSDRPTVSYLHDP